MFQAYASSFRSADLSRQVGAVIMSPRGDIVATGCNDVPSPGGGLYWSGDPHDKRDFQKTFDSNAREKNAMLERLLKALGLIESDAPKAALDELVKKHRDALKETGLLDITEFGRAVHAEMEALLSCARTGATTRDCILFSTTFPCHNCAKHIVAAGIARVVYIEPYPKSKALELHDDAIHLASDTEEHATCGGPSKVSFEPFVGIGPRCFVDLFSLSLGDGRGVERKTSDGSAIEWTRAAAGLRVPVQPTSYIEIESAVGEFMEHHLITESEE
jgi:deoxycytidylate deaminase